EKSELAVRSELVNGRKKPENTVMQDVGHDPDVPVLLTGWFEERYGYRTERPGGSRTWLAFYTVAGGGQIETPDRTHVTEPGELVLLEARRPHRYFALRDRPWHFGWAHFAIRAEWRTWMRWSPDSAMRVVRDGDGRLEGAIRQLREADASGHALRDPLAWNAIERLLLLASRDLAVGGVDGRVERVMRDVRANLAADLSTTRLAARVGLSESQLGRLFRGQTGHTVREYVEAQRFARACDLLAHTDLSIGGVALAVGYADPAYFAARFRATYGTTPLAYRREKYTKNSR
ncbi:MAG: helix-turn-helix domain-containing protein, partial [Fimbriimonadaceae bacterium]|nr:helix-turn-helix domain-containing protein [Fimbriimonadaceae bacterium]